MNNRKNHGINIGSSSLLMIFVILCLVCFAALSIVSANADHKLTQKMLDRTTAYYTACNQAEQSISEIDDTLAALYTSSASEEEFFSQVGHSISYVIPISDAQSLEVSLNIQYPKGSNETFYQVSSWKVINTASFEYNSTLPVMQDL